MDRKARKASPANSRESMRAESLSRAIDAIGRAGFFCPPCSTIYASTCPSSASCC
ncbi:MAG TPA: hypothetical protein VKB27_08805 [Gammaproteobacteria bacterium]|nr:hypothetical protein [Gammaproteobacteria bacterium]